MAEAVPSELCEFIRAERPYKSREQHPVGWAEERSPTQGAGNRWASLRSAATYEAQFPCGGKFIRQAGRTS
ncbi:hypothetical protein D9M68_400840 [compost metagenome]